MIIIIDNVLDRFQSRALETDEKEIRYPRLFLNYQDEAMIYHILTKGPQHKIIYKILPTQVV